MMIMRAGTSFQYAKSGLRKKLVGYFDGSELKPHDTKSRKKKDLWQRLIKVRSQIRSAAQSQTDLRVVLLVFLMMIRRKRRGCCAYSDASTTSSRAPRATSMPPPRSVFWSKFKIIRILRR